MENSKPVFMTIKQIANEGILSEYCLRQMEKRGELPCVYSGRKCLVNYSRFLERLNTIGGEEK